MFLSRCRKLHPFIYFLFFFLLLSFFPRPVSPPTLGRGLKADRIYYRDTPEATWMVKDVPHSPGWTYNGGDGDFKGAANLTQLATQSLDDYIRT